VQTAVTTVRLRGESNCSNSAFALNPKCRWQGFPSFQRLTLTKWFGLLPGRRVREQRVRLKNLDRGDQCWTDSLLLLMS
jgi:hypothetical protein